MQNAAEIPAKFTAAVRILPLAMALAAGCDPKTSDRDLIYLDPSSANARLHQPARMFEKAVDGVFVDPRNAKEYAAGHIPGAVHLPLAEMKDAAGAALAGHNLYVVYDTDYGDIMAKAGAKRLLELGFGEVFVLQGGLKAWQKDGYSVVTGTERNGGGAAAPKTGDAAPAADAKPAGPANPAPR